MQINNRNLLVDYDEDSDTLYLYSSKDKVKNSLDLGNIIIDYNHDDEAIGLEFLEATETVRNFSMFIPKLALKDDMHIKKEALKQITKAHLNVETKSSWLILTFNLQLNNEEVNGKLSLPNFTENDVKRARILATA